MSIQRYPFAAAALLAAAATAQAATPAASHCSVSLDEAYRAAGGERWAKLAVETNEGTIQIPGLVGRFSSVSDIAGNIGGGLLKRYTVSFDYSRQQILFEPRGKQEANDFDRSGLWINRAKDAFAIVDRYDASPASKAGLEVGDRIVGVDGRAAGEWTLGELRTYLRVSPAGSRIKLEIERGGERSTRTLELADLLPPWPGAASAP